MFSGSDSNNGGGLSGQRDSNKNSTSVIISNGNAFLICVVIIFLFMILGFSAVSYMLGGYDEKIRQIQNVVFLGDPDKEEERNKKKWILEILKEALNAGLLVEQKEVNK